MNMTAALKIGNVVTFINRYAYPSLHRKKGVVTDIFDDFASVKFDNGFSMACRKSELLK